MKTTKYIFIYTLLLCMTAQGMTLYQICVGPDHCDSEIEWASSCHTQNSDSHNSHKSSFGHQDTECIDISVHSATTSRNITNSFHYKTSKPITIKLSASEHPFSALDFSNLKTNLFPVFTDTTTLSLASTILIV